MTTDGRLTRGSIPRHMLSLAAPLIAGNILQQLYNTIDAFVLGRFAGAAEFAAVGVAGSVMNLFIFLLTGACTGVGVIFAQLYGGERAGEFRRAHFIALTLGLGATVLIGGAGMAGLDALLRLICTPHALMGRVRSYLAIILVSLPAAFLYNLYGAMLRAVGRARAALLALAAAVAANFALDVIFVAALGLGIEGAAWATALSQGLSAALCLVCIKIKEPRLLFRRADCVMDRALAARTLRYSLVTALHQSSLYIGKLFVQGAVNSAGAALISAYTAATRIEGFANSFGDSGAAATSVLVAQNLGAGEHARVEKSYRCSLVLMLIMGVCCSAAMYLCAGRAVGFVLGEYSGAAYENACAYMRTVAVFYTLCFTGNTLAGYFDGIGRVLVPFAGAAGHIALRAMLSWRLIGGMGLRAVALATGIGWLCVNLLWLAIKARQSGKSPGRA